MRKNANQSQKDFIEIDPALYARTYNFLKEQRTALENVKQEIDSNEKAGIGGLDYLKSIVNAFLTCDFGSIFALAAKIVTSLCEKLKKENEDKFEKLYTTVLSAAIAIGNVFTILGCNLTPEQTTISNENNAKKITGKKKLDDLPKVKNVSKNKETEKQNNEEMVLCRICEEYVPVELMEEHSKNCVIAYENECKILTTDEKIKKLQKKIKKSFFHVDWPGNKETTITIQLPMLHILMLLDSTVNITTNDDNGVLNNIYFSVSDIPILDCNELMLSYLEKSKELITEKINAFRSLSIASSALEKTTFNLSKTNSFSVTQTTIADFEFLKPISRGSFARVFLGRKIKTQDIYAIKVTQKSILKHKNQVRRILTEKDILLKNSSPYIVKFCEHNLYLVMEYVPGGDLYSLLCQFGAFDEQSAKFYTAQIILALQYLHSKEIIHRDLKPDNILITESGFLKLTDFGLSLYGTAERRINEKEIVGTPDYIAPEIVLSNPHKFTADFWSLGAVLYEFLCGVPPFHADTESAVFANILKGKVDFDILREFDISETCISFVQSLLVMDPSKRLGANGFNELFSHPWFSGFDWDHIREMQPPYIPPVSNDTDTTNFTQKYDFGKDNSDIYDDIRRAKELYPKFNNSNYSFSQEIDYLSSSFVSEEEQESDLNTFPSVAITSLKQSSLCIAENTMKRSRSASGIDIYQPDDKKDSLLSQSKSFFQIPSNMINLSSECQSN